jgi:ring-1,2-phenylacetyl-CoA epoxidase subunit PaaD
VVTSAVAAALAAIPDPELPMVAITDLGMVHDVQVAPDAIHVAILPTFIGCPALDLIAAAIRDGLAGFGRDVVVEPTFVVPWTTERITPAGLAALARAGIAAPSDSSAVRCPYCQSDRVALDSAFGPTQCRSLYYCRACRQPFEAMKPV